MRFQVLGPLEVEADGGPVALGGPKERLLLALLLTRPNQVVSVEALLRGLWREQPPRSAGKTLQSHVMHLRRVLEPDRARGAAAEVLITREPGYLLRVPPESLDATRFEELCAAARRALASGTADEKAASMLRGALGLWRGQAFGEFLDSDVAAAESHRLGELRLVAMEDRIEADLRLSRHRELVAELEGLVKEHPLRERLWAQLLLALYRSGRQADALLAYRRARSILVEELGIDPGTDLRRLHAAILTQDSGLDLRRPVETATATELPQALEPVGPPLVGRSAELAWLRAAWTSATRDEGGVTFLAGGQGIGKTRLAAELAGMVHEQGGWVLYGRCAPTAHDPLQPFEHARVGTDRSPPTWPVSGPDPAPSAWGRELARSLVDQTDGAVLLILDDLHLAQAAALEALAGLAAVAVTRKLLVLGAYRDDEASAQLVDLIDRLDPSGRARRRLVPLNRDEVAQVLALYESEQSTWAAVDEVLERTGGLPLLVHDAAGERARAQAANQVQEAAGQIVRSRGHLRLVEAKLSGDLIDLHELQEHSQRVARLVTTQSPPAEQVDHPTAAICPYKGLARFEPDDAPYFFGRERLVAELVTHLIGAGLLGVVGPSGSGKSSLVRAGLLPVLREGMLPGSDRWRQLVIRPGEHPVRELARAVPRDGALDSSGTTDGEREPDDRPSPWRHDGDWMLRAIAGPDHLLLVVDQFEEAFTSCRDEAERAAFLAALTQGALSPENYVTVVIAVRADYYGRCAADPRLAGLLAANHLLVGPMHPHELRRTIELPARRAGLRLEPGLAEAMIGEIADQPGGLPLLSCALLEGWEHRQGRTLTLAAYQQAGGVRGAVARLAERAWQQLQPGDQDAARRIMIRLAGPGEGETVVRRRVSLSELAADGDERPAAVLHTLANHRLLTLGDQTVELAHEALLREWPRLHGWLEEDVQGRALHRHLIGAAKEWDAAGRDPGELYRGARLTGTLDWADAHDADLNPLERAFLNASRAAAEREVADARRQAEREAHTSRRLRGLLAGLAAILVLALIAGGLALNLRGRAERQALVADSGRLGALALTEDQLDRALLLARQGVALDDSLESRGDLLATLLRSPAATAVIRPQLDGITPLGLSPDGRLLAMGDYGGRVAVYDLQTRRPVPGDFRAGKSVNDLDFSPDGSLLAVATGGGLVQLWDVGTATLRRQLRTAVWATGVEFSADGRTLVTLSADEADTPSGLGDSFLTRWDVGNGSRLRGPVHVTSGGETLITTQDRQRLVIVTRSEVLVAAAGSLQPLHRFPSQPGQPDQFVASLRPTDGQTLALGLDGGAVEFLDLSSGRRRRLGRHEASVAAVAFSPDGATLATGGSDRKVTVWDVASGQPRETFQGHEGRIAGLRFSPEGRTLYSAGSSSVIVWDLDGPGRLGQPFSFGPAPARGSDSTPTALAVSPDGSVLATADGEGSDRVALRDIRAPKQIQRSLAPGIGRISAVAFSPDGKNLAVGGERSAPVLVDVASGAVTSKTAGGHDGGIRAVRFDPKGMRLVTAGGDRKAIVWDAGSGGRLFELRQPGDDDFNDTSAAWSPDGSLLATAGGAGKVVLWRVSDRQQVATLSADPLWATSVAFSPDGSLIAAGGLADKQVTLWEVATGKLVRRLPHPTIVVEVTFARSGKALATSAGDGTVRLWEAPSLRQIGLALPGPERWSVLGFDPGGNRLAALYDNGTALVWDVDPEHWKKRACAVVGRPLTREEWEELLPRRSYQPTCP